MPLPPVSLLAAQILSVFASNPVTPAQAAQKIAQKYQEHVASVTAGAALPVFTGTEGSRFSAALAPAFAAQGGAAAKAAGGFVQGMTGFWLAVPIIFSDGVNVGSPTVIPGLSSLQSSLVLCFQNTTNTAKSSADQIAAALDVATRTILVPLLPSNVLAPLT